MAKTRTTVTMSSDLLKAVKIRAARTGKREGEVIEAALRRGLGLDVFERLWARNDMGEDEAMELALEAQRSVKQNPEG
jgi:hypothetical protein